MAVPWIKIEHWTPDKPEVFQMAEHLGIDPDAVVGKLIRVWIWADQQTIDGNAKGNGGSVTKLLLDRISGVTGFADSLIRSGWLVEDASGLQFSNFDRHNGETAKLRALNAKRQAKFKASNAVGNDSVTVRSRKGNAKGNGTGVTSALPRKEEEKEEEHSLSENVLVKPKRKAFVPPTVEEVRAFCAERGNSVDAEQFVAHYESQGWKKSNGQRVINWQACVVSTWEKNNGRSSGGASGGLFAATGNGQGRGFQSRNEQRIASSAAALLEFATDDDDEAGIRQVDARIGPPQANDGVHQARIAGVVRGPAVLPVDGGQPGGDRDEPF